MNHERMYHRPIYVLCFVDAYIIVQNFKYIQYDNIKTMFNIFSCEINMLVLVYIITYYLRMRNYTLQSALIV